MLSRYFLFGFGLGKALAVARSMGVHLVFSMWFGRGGMSVLGVDVVEDGRLDTRSPLEYEYLDVWYRPLPAGGTPLSMF